MIEGLPANLDQFNDLEENSLDFYSAVRSLYRQKRKDDIRNGALFETDAVTGNHSAVPDYKSEGKQTAALQNGK